MTSNHASSAAFNPVQLHLAQSKPSMWEDLILDLAQRDYKVARLEADKVRDHEISCGFPRSDLCRAASRAIRQIDRMTGIHHPDLGGFVRSSSEFYQMIRPITSAPVSRPR